MTCTCPKRGARTVSWAFGFSTVADWPRRRRRHRQRSQHLNRRFLSRISEEDSSHCRSRCHRAYNRHRRCSHPRWHPPWQVSCPPPPPAQQQQQHYCPTRRRERSPPRSPHISLPPHLRSQCQCQCRCRLHMHTRCRRRRRLRRNWRRRLRRLVRSRFRPC